MTAYKIVGVLLAQLIACTHPSVQCEQNSNCDIKAGGICSVTGNGDRWCAYPDSGCPSGYRYSTLQIGDGLSGLCVLGADAGVPPPATVTSCLGLSATCGANGNDNCCSSPMVPGGTYFRSYDVAGDSASGDKTSPATISSFQLDKYEVTVERFRAFVMAGQGTQANPPATGAGANPHVAASGWAPAWNTMLPANTQALIAAISCDDTFSTWRDNNSHRPMNCITWYEAMAFCAWDGGYLPTEAQWNYAATGGDQQRAYPWATATLDPTHASYNDNGNCYGDGAPACTLADIVPVGTKPQGDGRWGQSDLSGNLYEWVSDYDGTYPVPCTDCIDLTAFRLREYRGGAWNSSAQALRTGQRASDFPESTLYSAGIRCAR